MSFLKSILMVSALCLPVTAFAQEVVLTVNQGEESVALTMEDLKSMPFDEFATTTQWTQGGMQVFKGVSLKDFVARFDVTEGTMRATAINDYTVEIPVSDAVENGPIIAYALNGEAMSVRENGPLWVIYPFDQNEEYQSEIYYSRSIWQLDRVTFAE
ncbi:hypothetical protein EDD53_0017 [Pacificibacter maritimus]|uniref:Oxidoreductase molybdopterin-binding domain-containing protein n=1 Tax=Pacificibacter maritimus TaxID=762213 RepID=A0A3N4ULN5_9RHOB|nr:molybdopterin-dependent oxidoreductase [Pacificibacter maritimus]RPE70908.1 hypothetical protein EDD53_0017 [Pacificibacter maritimus]